MVISVAGLVAVVLEIDARMAADESEELVSPTLPWLWGGRARRWHDFEERFRDHAAFAGWATEKRRSARRVTIARSRHTVDKGLDGERCSQASEALFSFERKGRSALLVFVRRDHMGHVLDAAAYDPEDYM